MPNCCLSNYDCCGGVNCISVPGGGVDECSSDACFEEGDCRTGSCDDGRCGIIVT